MQFYLREFIKISILLCLVVYLLDYYIISAILLGLAWQQIAFIGHDFGHQNDYLSINLLIVMLFGTSIQWWKRNHNIHHIDTNSIENDPDIQHLPFICIDSTIIKAQTYYSTYYNKWFNIDKVANYFVSKQHYLYYLAMAIARVNLYVQSFQLLIYNQVQNRYKELFCLLIYWIWYIYLVSGLELIYERVIFVCISHAVAGLVHVQITLSHFGMPAHFVEEKFIENQFKTTLNISSSPYLDWFHGGLQFQIEHHLFPRVPRSNLRALSVKVQRFAKDNNLIYRSLDFISANRLVLKQLSEVAKGVGN